MACSFTFILLSCHPFLSDHQKLRLPAISSPFVLPVLLPPSFPRLLPLSLHHPLPRPFHTFLHKVHSQLLTYAPSIPCSFVYGGTLHDPRCSAAINVFPPVGKSCLGFLLMPRRQHFIPPGSLLGLFFLRCRRQWIKLYVVVIFVFVWSGLSAPYLCLVVWS